MPEGKGQWWFTSGTQIYVCCARLIGTGCIFEVYLADEWALSKRRNWTVFQICVIFLLEALHINWI